jgi:hypothetical protein
LPIAYGWSGRDLLDLSDHEHVSVRIYEPHLLPRAGAAVLDLPGLDLCGEELVA